MQTFRDRKKSTLDLLLDNNDDEDDKNEEEEEEEDNESDNEQGKIQLLNKKTAKKYPFW